VLTAAPASDHLHLVVDGRLSGDVLDGIDDEVVI